MSLITPIGLLGLLGIVALIIIYILKPNYQQKVVSSTHVWKLSLKYRKKRLPMSRFRNILVLICQILILTVCAFSLARPVLQSEQTSDAEKVIVIDASASMLISDGVETRFERAVEEAIEYSEKILKNDGVISVIVADTAPYYLVQRFTKLDLIVVKQKLRDLIEDEDELACSYGSADIEKAISMAQSIVQENPKTDVVFYTATEYVDKNNIDVVNVADEDEWNVAILDCEAQMTDENYYNVLVDVGCYGKSRSVTVYCVVENPNGSIDKTETMSLSAEFFVFEEEKTLEFTPEVQANQLGVRLYSFESIYVYIEDSDSFAVDNSFYLYGGTQPEVKVLYSSTLPNNFFDGALNTIQYALQNTWDIDFKTHRLSANPDATEFILEGYDIYIFEHAMPTKMPTDGIVILVDPDTAPKNSGFRVAGEQFVNKNARLEIGDPHPLTDMMTLSSVVYTKYTKIASHDGFEELAYSGSDPVLLAKNEADEKVVILALDLNYSDFSMTMDFPIFLYNIFSYYMPATLTDYTYAVGDEVRLDARGENLTVSGGEYDELLLENLPAVLKVTLPGTYTLMQTDIVGDYIIENFFVGISRFESNITKTVDSLPLLYKDEGIDDDYEDILFWLALAMVTLLFVEWWLQSHEYF